MTVFSGILCDTLLDNCTMSTPADELWLADCVAGFLCIMYIVCFFSVVGSVGRHRSDKSKLTSCSLAVDIIDIE